MAVPGRHRPSAYQASGDDEVEKERSEAAVRTASLKRHIRSLGPYPVFSRDWFAMTASLQNIGAAALVDSAAAPTEPVASTLWDRSADVVARLMLEEGKVNLCLRNTRDWKILQRNLWSNADFKATIYGKLKLTEATVDANAVAFEVNMGNLLRCCFRAVETVQTTDIPLLVEHTVEVLQYALDNEPQIRAFAPSFLEGCQEAVVGHLLLGVFDQIEHLVSERLMELIACHNVLILLIRFVARFETLFGPKDLLALCATASAIVLTDSFVTRPDAFLSADAERELVAAWDAAIMPLLAKPEGAALSSRLRPLRDLVLRLKMLHG